MNIYIEEEGYSLRGKEFPCSVFIKSNWDDFGFKTTHEHVYYFSSRQKYDIGFCQIGYKNMPHGFTFPEKNEFKEEFKEIYFTLGTNPEYYKMLYDVIKQCNKQTKDELLTQDIKNQVSEILVSLNDVAYNNLLLDDIQEQDFFTSSFLRDTSMFVIKGQISRWSKGDFTLLPYSFSYKMYKSSFLQLDNETKKFYRIMDDIDYGYNVDFNIDPNSIIPTNIHALIGSNAVGKTTLIQSMFNCLITKTSDFFEDNEYGEFKFYDKENQTNSEFANVMYVSFSAFDNNLVIDESKNSITAQYIGLNQEISRFVNKKRSIDENTSIAINNSQKDNLIQSEFLISLFLDSFLACRLGRYKLFAKCIELLEIDPIFKDNNICSLADENTSRNVSDVFKRLSSGHKIVLLSITSIIAQIQERSLVLIDEPEVHLHPPLLSAYIRCLSFLLKETNGVAIIATHSPVVLQEIPSSCVLKLRRCGEECKAERLNIETFGENVGRLTREVFGLQMMDTGYVKFIQDLADKYESYNQAIEKINGQLGLEGKAILMSYYNRVENEEN